MRLGTNDGAAVEVFLSERNAKSLLAKVQGHPPGSACTLVFPGPPELVVKAVPDAEMPGYAASLGRRDSEVVEAFISESGLKSLLDWKPLRAEGGGAALAVTAEPDALHYGGRDAPPGRMHPDTEAGL